MANIKDVAAAVGVSEATVSRAMRGLAGVSAQVRQEILDTAESLQYAPSPIASALASGPTRTVGLLSADIGRWFPAQMVGAISALLSEAGYQMLVYDVPTREARARFFADMPLRKRVDAAITFMTLTEAEAASLRALRMPVALMGEEVEGFWSSDIDDRAAAQMAVEHLIGLGHSRIATIGTGTAPVERPSVSGLRGEGYRAALRAAGIPLDAALELDGASTVAGGGDAVDRLLALPEPPTAVFAHSDEMAFGALLRLRRRGLNVPDDVSVVGFDGHDLAEPFGLTTVAQPIPARAQALVEAALATLVAGSEPPPRRLLLPTRLLVRETTGPSREGLAHRRTTQDSKENR